MKSPVDLQALFEDAPRSVVVAAPDAPRFTVVAASRVFLRATGAPREAVLGRCLFEVMPACADDPNGAASRASMERARVSGEVSVVGAQRHTLPSMGGPPVERYWGTLDVPVRGAAGEVVYILRYFDDLTEQVRFVESLGGGASASSTAVRLRKAAELRPAPARSAGGGEDTLQAMVEQIPVAVAILDRDLRYLAVSRRWLADFRMELTPGALRGKRHFDLFPELPQHWRDLLGRCLAGETRRSDGDPFPRADGAVDWVRWQVQPWRGASGEVKGALIMSEDITALKRAEDQLQRWEHIFHNASWGLALATPDHRFIAVNQALARMHDSRPEDWIGRPLDDMLAASSKPLLAEIDATLRGSDHALYESTHVRSDGSHFSVLTEVTAYRDGHGEVLLHGANFQDITARKRTEETLQQSEDLVRTIAENSTQGLAMMDARGYCTYANRAWLDMTGYSAEEIGARPLHELVHHHHPDGRPYPMAECPIDRALPENFDVRAHEDTFFRKDGSTFSVMCAASPIFKDGKPASTVIEIRDVTEARRADAALRESEARFRDLADNMSQLAWMADASGARFWHNRRWLEYAAMSAEEARGWKWQRIYPAEELDASLGAYRAHIAAGHAWSASMRLRDGRGRDRWFLSQAVPVRDEGGRVIRWL
ncbi:MAG TPA: PAS domain S-box protein, partial [Myxococcota bacterium]|nr:PAS domain S-box protein [Myxococcota bacterium]